MLMLNDLFQYLNTSVISSSLTVLYLFTICCCCSHCCWRPESAVGYPYSTSYRRLAILHGKLHI